jgi:hypothetical protein
MFLKLELTMGHEWQSGLDVDVAFMSISHLAKFFFYYLQQKADCMVRLPIVSFAIMRNGTTTVLRLTSSCMDPDNRSRMNMCIYSV